MYKPHQHCPYSHHLHYQRKQSRCQYFGSIASLPLHGSTIVKQLLVQRFTDFLVAVLTVESFLHLVDILDDTVTVHVKSSDVT